MRITYLIWIMDNNLSERLDNIKLNKGRESFKVLFSKCIKLNLYLFITLKVCFIF